MRLIDADELREVMYHQAFETDSDMQKWDGGCWIRYKMFEKAIDSVPTIEAEPERRKGRWIIYTVSPFDGEDVKCSECGQCGCAPYWNFCPNCGAAMQEDES